MKSRSGQKIGIPTKLPPDATAFLGLRKGPALDSCSTTHLLCYVHEMWVARPAGGSCAPGHAGCWSPRSPCTSFTSTHATGNRGENMGTWPVQCRSPFPWTKGFSPKVGKGRAGDICGRMTVDCNRNFLSALTLKTVEPLYLWRSLRKPISN